MTTGDKPYDTIVFIGRFQPFHIGHQHIIDRALQRANKVVVLVGSANESPSPKNPFSCNDRIDMINKVYRFSRLNGDLAIEPLDNHPSDERWVKNVHTAVNRHVRRKGEKTAITGFEKDGSSFYLKWFPDWDIDLVDAQFGTFNATEIRKAFFQALPVVPTDVVPEEVAKWLFDYRLRPAFADMMQEYRFLDAYAEAWRFAPFNKEKPQLITVDAIVEQNKKVLLIRRKAAPGRGLLALPGGFLGPDESLRDAAVRELREETLIADGRGKIPHKRLANFIRDDLTKVFDDPNRDLRGRCVTHAHFFDLPDGPQWKVKGDDDAESAQWYDIAKLRPTEFYSDHYHILSHYFGL